MKLKLIPVLLIATFAKADNLAYVASSSGDFGAMDLNTGAFTPASGSLPYTLRGLGALDGTLYATEAFRGFGHDGTLFTLNPAGSLTPAGPDSSLIYESFGSTSTGLFAVGYNPLAATFVQDLYSINPATGAASLIGPTGLGITAPYTGLSTNSSTLYYSYNGFLYTLNTATGAASLVGSFGGNSGMGALVWEDGTLYGADNNSFTIDTINTGTGFATIGSHFVETQFGAIFGLAPDSSGTPTVPEPASIVEIGLGLCSLGAFRRWRGKVGRRQSTAGYRA